MDYCKVVLWVDINKWKNDKRIFHPKEIVNVVYDKIVISIADSNIRTSIFNYLIDLGVSSEKIV